MHFPIICSKYLCNCCWIFISVSLMWITFAKSACIFPCSNEVKVGNIFNQKLPSTHKKQRKNDNTREFRMQPKTWECFLLGQYNSRSSVWLPLAEGREHVKRPATNDRLEQARRAQSSWLDNSHNLDLIMQSEGGKSIFTFSLKTVARGLLEVTDMKMALGFPGPLLFSSRSRVAIGSFETLNATLSLSWLVEFRPLWKWYAAILRVVFLKWQEWHKSRRSHRRRFHLWLFWLGCLI